MTWFEPKLIICCRSSLSSNNHFCTKNCQLSINFHDNSKNKNRKMDFPFDSAHWASFMKMGSKLRGRVCISLVGTWSRQFSTDSKISCSRRNLFEILLNQTEIRLNLPFPDWFGTKRTSVWFQISRKVVNTIWFPFDLTRFLCVHRLP